MQYDTSSFYRSCCLKPRIIAREKLCGKVGNCWAKKIQAAKKIQRTKRKHFIDRKSLCQGRSRKVKYEERSRSHISHNYVGRKMNVLSTHK